MKEQSQAPAKGSSNVATTTIDATNAPLVHCSAVWANDRLNCELHYQNPGSSDLNHVELRCVLPSGVTFVSAESGGVHDPVENVISWELESLPTQTTGQIGFVLDRTEESMSQSELTTGIRSDEMGDVLGASTPFVAGLPVLELHHAVSHTAASPGELVVHTLNYCYNGEATVDDVLLTAALPPRCTLISATGAGVSNDNRQIAWTIGQLTPGASGTLLFTLRLEPIFPEGQTRLTSVAMLTARGLKSARSMPVETLVDAQFSLQPVLSVDRSRAKPGETITATITITNTGNADANDVMVTAPPVTGALLEGAPGEGAVAQWQIGEIAAGNAQSLTWQLQLNSVFPSGSSTILIDANVQSSTAAPIAVQSPKITVVAKPKIELSLSGNKTIASPGEDVAYTVKYANVGTAAVRDLKIALPLGEQVVSAKDIQGADVDSNARQISASLDLLGPGDVGEFSLIATLASEFAAGATDIETKATASSSAIKPVYSDIHTLSVVARADLCLSSQIVPARVIPGEAVELQIPCVNNGNAAATNIRVTALLPKNISLVGMTDGLSYDDSTGIVTWTISTLGPGETSIVNCGIGVDSILEPGEQMFEIPCDALWPDGEALGSVAILKAVAEPQIELALTVDQSEANPSDVLVYNLNYVNKGAARSSVTHLRVKPDINCKVIETVPQANTERSRAGEFTIAVGDLSVNQSGSAVVKVRLDSQFPAGQTAVQFTALVEAANLAPTQELSAITQVQSSPLLTLSTSAHQAQAIPGETLAVTVQCTNNGTAPATKVRIVTTIPEYTNLVSISGEGKHHKKTQQVSWPIDALAPEKSVGFGLVLQLDPTFPEGTTTLQIPLKTSSKELGEHSSEPLLTEVQAASQPVLTAHLDSHHAIPGDRVHFTVTCSNHGNSDLNNALVYMPLPKGTQFLSASGTGAFDPETDTIQWSVETVSVIGEPVVCSAEFKLNPVFENGSNVLPFVGSMATSGAESISSPTTELTVIAEPDPLLSLTADRSHAAPGDTVRYTINWCNQGGADASGVQIVNALPMETEFVEASHSGECSDTGLVTWQLGAVPAGASGELLLDVRIRENFAPGVTDVVNVAAINADDVSRTSNDVSIMVEAVPVLQPTVSLDCTSAEPGDALTYRISCNAIGPAPASDVQLIFTYPTHLSVDTTGTKAKRSKKNRTLSWSFDSFEPGQEFSVEIPAFIDEIMPAGLTELCASIQVSSEQTGIVEGHSATVQTHAAPIFDLNVQSPKNRVKPSETVELGIAITNHGNAHANDVVVSIPLSEHVTTVWGPDGSGDLTDRASGTMRWRIGALNAGSTTETTYTLRLNDEFPPGWTQIGIAAAATSAEGVVGGCPPTLLEVIASPLLSAAGSVSPSTAAIGDTVTWTATIENTGAAAARDVQITLPLPHELQPIDNPKQSRGSEEHANTVFWWLDELRVNQKHTVDISTLVQPGFLPGTTPVTAQFDVRSQDAERAVSAPIICEVNADLELELSLDADGTTKRPGDLVTFKLTYSNVGTARAEDMHLCIPLPKQTRVHSIQGPGRIDEESTSIIWALEPLPTNCTSTIKAQIRLAPIFPAGTTDLDFCAAISSGSDEPFESNCVTITVESLPQLEVATATSVDRVCPGQTVTFTVAIRNTGNGDAENVLITDKLPDGCQFLSASDGGSYDQETGTVSWKIPHVPGGARDVTSVTWDLNVLPGTVEGEKTIVNCPTAQLQQDDAVTVEPAIVIVETTEAFELKLQVAASSSAALSGTRASENQLRAAPDEVVTYTIHIENAGGIEVDTLPLEFTLPAHATPVAASDAGQLSPDGTQYLWSLAAPKCGQTLSVNATVQLDPTFPAGQTSLLASAMLGTQTPTQQSTTVMVAVVPELKLNATIDKSEVSPGDEVTINLGYRVGGAADAPDIELHLPIPKGLRVKSLSEGGEVIGTDLVAWVLGDGAVGDESSEWCTLVVQPSFEAGEEKITTRASVCCGSADTVFSPPLTLQVVTHAKPLLELAFSEQKAAPGSDITLRCRMSNDGNAVARGLKLAVQIPDGIQFIEANIPSSLNGKTLQLSPHDVELNQQIDALIQLRIGHDFDSGATPVKCSASVTHNTGDGRCSATEILEVYAAPQVELICAGQPIDAQPGDQVTWALTVTNTGLTRIKDVALCDRIPDLCTFISSPDTPEHNTATNALVWAIPELPANQSITVHWQGQLVDEFPVGLTSVTNDTSVACESNGVVLASESADVHVNIQKPAEIIVDVETSHNTAEPGETVQFTMTVRNSGGTPAEDIVVQSQLSDGLRLVDVNQATQPRMDTPLKWEVEQLGPEEAFVCTWCIEVDPVFQPGQTSLPVSWQCLSSAHDTPATGTIDFSVIATHSMTTNCAIDNAKPLPGDTVTANVYWENSGNAVIENAVLILELPPHTAIETQSNGGTYDEAGHVVRWQLPTLLPSDSGHTDVQVVLSQLLEPGTTESIFQSKLSAAQCETIESPAAIATTTVVPELELVTQVYPGDAGPGDEITWTLTVTNAGKAHITQLVLYDQAPEQCQYVDSSDDVQYDKATRELRWTIPEIPASHSANIEWRGRLDDEFPVGKAQLMNAARVALKNDDYLLANASTALEFDVLAPPNLEVTLLSTASRTEPGQSVEFSMMVENSGGTPANQVTVNTMLPDGIEATHANHGIEIGGDRTLSWGVEQLAPGGSFLCTWTVKVEHAFGPGETILPIASKCRAEDVDTVTTRDMELTVVTSESLSVVCELSDLQPSPGDSLEAIIRWENNGNAVIEDAELSLTTPLTPSLFEVSDSGRCDDSKNTIYWPLPTLNPAMSGVAKVTVELPEFFDAGILELPFQASISAPGCRIIDAPVAVATTTAEPVITIELASDQSVIAPNDRIEVTLHWANTGTAHADAASVKLMTPTGLTLVDVQDNGVIADDHVLWDLGEVPHRGTGSVSASLKADGDFDIGETHMPLSVAVSAMNLESETINAGSVTVNATAALELETQVDRVTARPGDYLNYSFTISNTGNATAKNVDFNFEVPNHCEFVSSSSDSAWDEVSHSIRMLIEVIPPAQTLHLSVSIRLEATFPAGTTEIAGLASLNHLGETLANANPALTNVEAQAKLELELNADRREAQPGDIINYSVTIANVGNATSDAFQLQLLIPELATPIESASAMDPDSRLLVCPIDGMAVGYEANISFQLRLADVFPYATSELDVVARLEGEELNQVERQSRIWVYAAPILSMTVSSDQQTLSANGTAGLNLVLTNSGNAVAEHLSITLEAPYGCEPMLEDSSVWDPQTRMLLWHAEKLKPNEQLNQSAIFKLNSMFPSGTTALIWRGEAKSGDKVHAAGDSWETRITAAAKPEVAIRPTRGDLKPGDELRMLVNWSNTGDSPTTGAAITLMVPEHCQFVSAEENALYDPVARAVRWEIGRIDAGVYEEANVTFALDPVFPHGETQLVPEITLTSAESPPVHKSVAPIGVNAAPDLVVDTERKTDVPEPNDDNNLRGTETLVTITLIVTNQGCADAVQATISEELPAGSHFVTASDGGTYNSQAHSVTWRLGTVAAGAKNLVRSAVVRFEV